MFFIYWILGLIITVYFTLFVIKRNREMGYTVLIVLSAGFILISNILTPRIIAFDLGVCKLSIVTGSLIWPFTAQLSDMINEIYGKKKTIYGFALAYLINLLFVIFVMMAKHTTPVWSGEEEAFWLSYFIPSGRIFLASTISFVVSQLLDIQVYSSLKEKFREKEECSSIRALALRGGFRNVLSDIFNMTVDGALFSILAFMFVLPFDDVVTIIVSSITIKVFMATIDTPLFVWFRIKIRNEKRNV